MHKARAKSKISILLTFILAAVMISLLFTPFTVDAGDYRDDLRRLERSLENNPLLELSDELVSEIEELLARYQVRSFTPKSCPLDSDRYLDILTQVTNIKTLFRDGCLDNDQQRLAEMLSGAQNIQDTLDEMRASRSTGEDSEEGDEDSSSSGLDFALGGIQLQGDEISNLFTNINTLFVSGQCDFDRGSFLNQTADLIQSFAQMGLVVPNQNGLVVAGGGLALSSMLRAIDGLFTSRFDFEEIQDRQTFVKLNCAFYDLRAEIRETGMFDIPTRQHHHDLDLAQHFLALLRSYRTELNETYHSHTGQMSEIREAQLQGNLSFLASFDELLVAPISYVENSLLNQEGHAPMLLRMQMLHRLGGEVERIYQTLQQYIQRDLSSFLAMDLHLRRQLQQFRFGVYDDKLDRLLAMEIEDFDNFRQEIHYHLMRLRSDIVGAREALKTQWMEDTLFSNGNNLNQVFTELSDQKNQLSQRLYRFGSSLEVISERIRRVLDQDGYRPSRDSSENLVYVLEQFDDIVAQIYGKWGYEFVRYTSRKADRENKRLNRRFRSFSRNYMRKSSDSRTGYVMRDPQRLSELELINACQDALPFRRNWRLSDGLIRQTFDFLMTNQELFHGNIPRGFLMFRRDWRRLKNHYTSSFYAQEIFDGRTVARDDYNRHVDSRYGFNRRKLTGRVMLEVNGSLDRMAQMQEVIERYQCHDRLLFRD